MSPLRRDCVLGLALVLALTTASCVSGGHPSASPGAGEPLFSSIFKSDLSARQPGKDGAVTAQAGGGRPGEAIYLGSGSSNPQANQTVSSYAPGDFSLNFENADLKEVVQSILGNALKVNYSIDPTVSGSVTISSARPVAEDDLVPILEMVLQMNGASLLRDGELYRIVPEASAVSQWGDVGDARPGYGISILPLRYVSAQTLISLIDGFGTRPGAVRAESARNLLIVLGNSADRQAAIETALSFDADWMQDQSVAVLPLQNAKPEAVIPELQRIFKAAEGGMGADLVQFMPMPRLKAVLVVASQRDTLERARTWVQRLDTDNPSLEANIYVYRVKYREAKKLADLLNQLFGAAGGLPGTEPTEQIEPGAEPVTTESGFDDQIADGFSDEEEQPAEPDSAVLQAGDPDAPSAPLADGTRIQADISNNSVVIYADLEMRQKILAALVHLDVPPLQVAINITMAEILLTDELRHGVQYFVKSKNVGLGDDNGSFGLFNGTANNIARELPGFNFVFGSERSPDVIIDAFDQVTDVSILSSPSLVVMENEVARFQVGDQIPIVTRTVSDVDTGDANTLATSNEVEYRDTGIILNVKPRVAENGVVSMTIEQEISSVTAGSNTLTPTISNRKVASSISVVDGQTVLLGGLISEQGSHGKSGIPGLHRMRVIGNLFGRTSNETRRNELIILIRPSVIRDSLDAQHVAEELRTRLWSLGSFARALMAPPAGARSGLPVGCAGFAFGAIAGLWQHLPPLQVGASAILAGAMMAIAAVDYRHFKVPDALSIVTAVAGLAVAWLGAPAAGQKPIAALAAAALAAILCGGALLALREAFFRLRGVDGLGLGDVKLAAAGGIWLGWQLFASAVMLAAIGALAFVAARTLAEGAWPAARRIPFALYLAPAIWICWYLAAALGGFG